jgi:cyclic pyranopterin phosphate synthase
MKENRRGRRGHGGEKKRLSHVDAKGEARMVDVGEKPVVARVAVAEATLVCAAGTVRLLKAQALPKGDVLAVARVAGIQAAKQTAGLIPLCHALPLDAVKVDFRVMVRGVRVTCTVRTRARTGVEMEALTGATVAALTLYDMCKAVDKGMRVEGVRVVEKRKAEG